MEGHTLPARKSISTFPKAKLRGVTRSQGQPPMMSAIITSLGKKHDKHGVFNENERKTTSVGSIILSTAPRRSVVHDARSRTKPVGIGEKPQTRPWTLRSVGAGPESSGGVRTFSPIPRVWLRDQSSCFTERLGGEKPQTPDPRMVRPLHRFGLGSTSNPTRSPTRQTWSERITRGPKTHDTTSTWDDATVRSCGTRRLGACVVFEGFRLWGGRTDERSPMCWSCLGNR